MDTNRNLHNVNVNLSKYVTEFIGTFFLVLTIGYAGLPAAIASILMVMIYAGGHVSGGHYNPAVTLGVWLRGRLGTDQLAPYMTSQFLGAVAAAFLINFLKGGALFALTPAAQLWQFPHHAFIAEFLFTFALVYVVLNVATSRTIAGNSFYGLAIGATVLAGALSVGAISGAAFNPAVALAISVMGIAALSSLWIYFLAQFLAATFPGWLFTYLNPEDR